MGRRTRGCSVVRALRPLSRELSIVTGRYPVLVPVDELARWFRVAALDLVERVDGPLTYFEAGVFAGQSLAVWHEVTASLGIPTRIIAADSFLGLPESVEDDDGDWSAGEFACSLGTTKRNLRRLGVALDQVRFIEGWFDRTLTPALAAEIGPVHVVMADADAYSSTVPVLRFLSHALAERAWVIFDDWFTGGNHDPVTGTGRGQGVERAFAEWCAADPRWTATEMGTYEHTAFGSTFPAGRILRLDRRMTDTYS